MWFVIALIFTFAISLIPGVQQKFESTVEGVSGALTEGPVNTVTNAWIKILAVAAAAGIGLWLLETKIARHEGIDAPGPPALPAPPTAPSFSAQSGYTVSGGPVSVTSGVGAGTGGAAPSPPEPRVNGFGGGFGGGRGGKDTRSGRK